MYRNTGNRNRGRKSREVTPRRRQEVSRRNERKNFFALVVDFVIKITAKKPSPKSSSNWSAHYKQPYRASQTQPRAYTTEADKPPMLEILKVFVGFLGSVLMTLLFPLRAIGRFVYRRLAVRFRATDVFRAAFTCAFVVITIKFAQLQVLSNTSLFAAQPTTDQVTPSVILAKRAQIKIKDLSQNKEDIPVTASHILSNVFFQPRLLKIQITNGLITLEEAAELVAGGLNLEYDKVYATLKREVDKEEVIEWAILEKYISKTQRDAVDYLRYPDINDEGLYVQTPLYSWLGHDTVEVRVYPENELLSNTLGFVPRYTAPREEALNSGCADLVRRNEERGTGYNGYVIGNYGLEQKYCSALGGVNGLTLFAQDVGTDTEQAQQVQHGSDIYLTIDINIQRKAEEVLENAFKSSTNKLGEPKDGVAIVMEAETGKILAMASAPTFDPNEYDRVLDTRRFYNAATAGDYEVGSVMKPLTVAATVNDYQIGQRGEDGTPLGTPPDWSFEDYGPDGKVYLDANGYEFTIQNADGYSYQGLGDIDLSQILRDSINTGIAEIIPTIGNERLRDYFTDRFKVGKPTYLNMPGDQHGYAAPLVDEKNLYSDFSFAIFGFGQGFTMSPVQLMRAYTPLANDGVMVEPYMVEKILSQQGIEQELAPKDPPTKVIEPATARLVTSYMVNTVDQGYLGKRPSKGQVEGYAVAGKTGTAEVGRKPVNSCGSDLSFYACNRSQGIYDHTYIGYGPEKDAKYIVLLKLSEPDRGNVQNFAENTLGPAFSELMQYTLEYNRVPKDR